jgi:hypothetical protein
MRKFYVAVDAVTGEDEGFWGHFVLYPYYFMLINHQLL